MDGDDGPGRGRISRTCLVEQSGVTECPKYTVIPVQAAEGDEENSKLYRWRPRFREGPGNFFPRRKQVRTHCNEDEQEVRVSRQNDEVNEEIGVL